MTDPANMTDAELDAEIAQLYDCDDSKWERYDALRVEQDRRIEAAPQGRSFVFASPFEGTDGWLWGDTGTILRLCRPPDCDSETHDLWVARRDRDGAEATVWGGECYDPTTFLPAVPEHRFTMPGWETYPDRNK